ncbi:putative RING finger [Hyphodiscus hymeniophilus]|uniref:RING finger n=1 Tax=Hyphodiscus hymeniophilus TaxID=353542 RepID=A0A9P6VCM1_9HELO|nr:putative RING finger [Hyphodiscus hymeniophilus]
MSSLVSDLLINPVLRQARRFSRSNTTGPPLVDPVTNQRIDHIQRNNEAAIDDQPDAVEDSDILEAVQERSQDTLSGVPLSSSPIEEDGGLEDELAALEVTRRSGTPPAVGHPVTARLASLRSDSGRMDEDVSDNPSYGIPGRFRTNSATSSTSLNSSARVLNTTMNQVEAASQTSTQDQPGSMNYQRSGSLPADDGMGPLRQQIRMIQALEVPAEQKARMMHRLLTQGYNHAQEIYQAKHQPRTTSPSSMISQERPATPASLSSFIWQINGSGDEEIPGQQHIFRLSPDDLKRTYALPDSPELDDDGVAIIPPKEEKEAVQVLGCQHYKRNVKLQCSTCDRWYTCRLCHDEVEDHVLIRKDTTNMLCMLCGSAQRAGEFCVECGERTAWYYCNVCKLWDNDPNKSIYHCNDCGICRKGRGLGKDFFHCKTCGTCMSMSVERSHKCIERVSDCDCPICGDYMFTSPRPVVFMLCGHSIHQTCYYEHMKSSYKCPICSKSTVNMETQFQNLTRAIETQPMPPQFQDTKAMVSCNDCYAKSAVKYHWLGLKCAICDSYNTAQLSILSDPAVEVPIIESREVDNDIVSEQTAVEAYLPTDPTPGSGLVRHRRHSLHAPTPSTLAPRYAPYPVPQRIGRSVSPARGSRFFENAITVNGGEMEEAVGEEDDLDFWGRDEPRKVTSMENIDVNMDEEGEQEDSSDDSDSEMEVDEGDEADEGDEFELFGHR